MFRVRDRDTLHPAGVRARFGRNLQTFNHYVVELNDCRRFGESRRTSLDRRTFHPDGLGTPTLLAAINT